MKSPFFIGVGDASLSLGKLSLALSIWVARTLFQLGLILALFWITLILLLMIVDESPHPLHALVTELAVLGTKEWSALSEMLRVVSAILFFLLFTLRMIFAEPLRKTLRSNGAKFSHAWRMYEQRFPIASGVLMLGLLAVLTLVMALHPQKGKPKFLLASVVSQSAVAMRSEAYMISGPAKIRKQDERTYIVTLQ